MRVQTHRITKTTIQPNGDKAALYVQAIVEPRGAAIVCKPDAGEQRGAHITLRVDRAAQAFAWAELFQTIGNLLRVEEEASLNLSQLALREIDALTATKE